MTLRMTWVPAYRKWCLIYASYAMIPYTSRAMMGSGQSTTPPSPTSLPTAPSVESLSTMEVHSKVLYLNMIHSESTGYVTTLTGVPSQPSASQISTSRIGLCVEQRVGRYYAGVQSRRWILGITNSMSTLGNSAATQSRTSLSSNITSMLEPTTMYLLSNYIPTDADSPRR